MKKVILSIFSLVGVVAFTQQVNPSVEWIKSYGEGKTAEINNIQKTSDGGFVFAGALETSHSSTMDVWVAKMSSSGEIEWQKNYGSSDDDIAHFIQQTTDGGFIVVGYASLGDRDVTHHKGQRDIWVLKLASNGDLEWQKTFGGSRYDESTSILQTPDGGYVLAASCDSFDGDFSKNRGKTDAWLIKLKPNGDFEWMKNYGGFDDDEALSVQLTADNHYLVAGRSNSTGISGGFGFGDYDYWLLKIDSSTGKPIWQRPYGGTENDMGRIALVSPNGGYIMGGYSNSEDGDIDNNKGKDDFWLIKLDDKGLVEWKKNYGGNNTDLLRYMQSTNDKGYILIGESQSTNIENNPNKGKNDALVIKINESGEVQWQKMFGGNLFDRGVSVLANDYKTYLVSINSSSQKIEGVQNQGAYIIKLKEEDLSTSEYNKPVFKLYPNPSNGEFVIHYPFNNDTVEIYSTAGQLVYKKENLTGSQVEINLHYPAGVYFVKVNNARSKVVLR